MATATKSTKTTAKPVKTQAEVAERRTRGIRPATTDVKDVLSTTAYAYLGATDKAVELAKTLPERLNQLSVAELRERVERDLDSYADRGRRVVTSIRKARATERAVEQTRAARAHLKTALRSVRRAAAANAEAVDRAADKVGVERAS